MKGIVALVWNDSYPYEIEKMRKEFYPHHAMIVWRGNDGGGTNLIANELRGDVPAQTGEAWSMYEIDPMRLSPHWEGLAGVRAAQLQQRAAELASDGNF